MGTDELKQVFKLGADIARFIELGMNASYLKLLAMLPTVVGDLRVISKASMALTEYAAMTDPQAADLEAYVESVVSLDNKPVEVVIEQVFKVLVDLHALAGMIGIK